MFEDSEYIPSVPFDTLPVHAMVAHSPASRVLHRNFLEVVRPSDDSIEFCRFVDTERFSDIVLFAILDVLKKRYITPAAEALKASRAAKHVASIDEDNYLYSKINKLKIRLDIRDCSFSLIDVLVKIFRHQKGVFGLLGRPIHFVLSAEGCSGPGCYFIVSPEQMKALTGYDIEAYKLENPRLRALFVLVWYGGPFTVGSSIAFKFSRVEAGEIFDIPFAIQAKDDKFKAPAGGAGVMAVDSAPLVPATKFPYFTLWRRDAGRTALESRPGT